MCEADSDGMLSAQLTDSILSYLPTDDISLASAIDDGSSILSSDSPLLLALQIPTTVSQYRKKNSS